MARPGRRLGKLLGQFGVGNTTTLRASFVEPVGVLGQPVHVRVGVLAREPVEVRSGEVTFRRTVRHDEYDVALITSWVRLVDREVLGSAQFLAAGRLEAGTEVERVLSFATPVQGPPTGITEHTAAWYNAIATLQLVDALDVTVQIQVKLLSPRSLNPGSESTILRRTSLTSLDVRLDRSWAQPGESLAGEVVAVAVGQPVEARRLTVGLARWEQTGYRSGKSAARDHETSVATQVLAQPVHLDHGVVLRVPFTVTVPADACPTFSVPPKNAVRWVVRATLGRGMVGDETFAREVNVYTAPDNSPGVVRLDSEPRHVAGLT